MSDKILIDALFPKSIRVAHVKNNELENFNFEVAGNVNVRGNIYLGKVLRVENSLQAAFVDYGGGRNGFLSISEIHPDYFHLPLEEKQKIIEEIRSLSDDKNEEGKELPAKELARLYRAYNISSLVKVGQLALVQGIKEERGNKGATLTTYISLAGRYCVYMANTPNRHGISRKIHNISERQRIREIIAQIHEDKAASVVIRTAGEGVSKEYIVKDHNHLASLWSTIKKKTLSAKAPSIVHEDGSIIKNVIREYCTSETQEVMIDGKTAFLEAEKVLENPAYRDLKLIKHNSRTPLFVTHKVEDKITDLLNPVVYLPSGASLVIQQTEALISIDINSGKSTGEVSVEETAVKTNREAAKEIARQLKLRNLSGLIVIDFIDMYNYANRRIIEKEFKSALESDRARVQILQISNFGLMEVSRQRTAPTLLEVAGDICPTCNGGSFVQSTEYLAMSLLRQITSFIHKTNKQIKKIQVGTRVETIVHILNYKAALLKEIEIENNVRVVFAAHNDAECNISDISKEENSDTIFLTEKDCTPEDYKKDYVKKPKPIKKSYHKNKKDGQKKQKHQPDQKVSFVAKLKKLIVNK